MPCIYQSEKLREIIRLLHRMLRIRITFFDMRQVEFSELNVVEMCEFCRRSRLSPAFDELCRTCDEEHLELAKRERTLHIYHCHAGLLEAIVPLYSDKNEYLGAIFFGQIADRDRPPPQMDALMAEIRRADMAEMEMMGNLLKYLGEYICDHELISRPRERWADRLEEYIDRHLDEPLPMKRLSELTGYSASFLSHNFRRAFGLTVKKYIRMKRLQRARRMLAEGRQVRECAFALGYSDEFYFSRDFRKYFGYPPKNVKRREGC